MAFFNCSDDSSFSFLISILSTLQDRKNVLRSSSKRNKAYFKVDREEEAKILSIPSGNIIFEFIDYSAQIQEHGSKLKKEKEEIAQLAKTKDWGEFINIKSIESDIIKLDCLYHYMIQYIKGIYSLFDKYITIKQFLSKNPKNALQCSRYSALAQSIKNFKSINTHNWANSSFYLARSTIKSEFSEEMSYLSLMTQDIGLNQSNHPTSLLQEHCKDGNDKIDDNKQYPSKDQAKTFTIPKFSNKIHQKKIIDDDDVFLDKDDNVPTEETEKQVIKDIDDQNLINVPNDIDETDKKQKSFEANDVECDFKRTNTIEQKHLKQINFLSIRPSKMIQEKLLSSKRKA